MSEPSPDLEVEGPKQPPHEWPARWSIRLGLVLPFTTLTFLAASSGSVGDVGDRPVALATLSTIVGPFVGAIALDGQPCCLAFSARIPAATGPALALVLIAQIAPLPLRGGRRAVGPGSRMLGFVCNLLVWPVADRFHNRRATPLESAPHTPAGTTELRSRARP